MVKEIILWHKAEKDETEKQGLGTGKSQRKKKLPRGSRAEREE